jgi:hypothetical protein
LSTIGGTSHHSLYCSDDGRYLTNNGQSAVCGGRQHTQANLSAGARRLSIRCGPIVPIAMATREDVRTNADLQGLLKQARMYPVSFGGRRSIYVIIQQV